MGPACPGGAATTAGMALVAASAVVGLAGVDRREMAALEAAYLADGPASPGQPT